MNGRYSRKNCAFAIGALGRPRTLASNPRDRTCMLSGIIAPKRPTQFMSMRCRSFSFLPYIEST